MQLSLLVLVLDAFDFPLVPSIVWVYGLVLPPLDPALEAVRSHLGPGQGLDAVKLATQMANRSVLNNLISSANRCKCCWL